ncbi:MAG: Na+/H+ antiporter [Anaerolineales bacterium]|nr:MAG: Na+/H+ antiporter [Anaerolineales bacterium]
MSEIFVIEEYAVALLLIATLVGIVARRSRMPYTVGLVIVGAALAILYQPFHIEVEPELILGIFVPPLIFEAAFHLPIKELRRNITSILALAIVGVLLTTFLVGGIVHLGSGMDITSAIVFGSIIAATDPVAVIALFGSLGVPKRLQVLLEGESLLNDGTAIVVFNIAVTAAVTGSFDLREGIGEFIFSAGMGLGIGLVLGLVASFIISKVDDYLIETAITFVLAYGAFILAEMIHVSGVLAVVAAGLVNGNIGPRGMSSTTRIVVYNFWDFMSFLANSFVFLMIGLVVDLPLLVDNWRATLWGILAALLSRLIVIYGLFPRSKTLPFRWKHILFWGGLRGAISLALVLGLTTKIGREVSGQLQAMVFGLVVFTLLVQGTSMNWLVKRTGIIHRREERDEYDLRRARASTTRAAYDHLKKIHKEGMISKHVWDIITKTVESYSDELTKSLQEILKQHPNVEAEELDSAWREFLQYQRLALAELLADRGITEDVFNQLSSRIDNQLASSEIAWDSAEKMDRNLWQLGARRTDLRSDSD